MTTPPRLAGCVRLDGATTHVYQSIVEDHERCFCVLCKCGFVCSSANEHIERRRKLAKVKKGGRP